MSNYVMTPARRAALRKAQLVSARRRRRHSVAGYALHDARQRVAIAYREGQLHHYKANAHQAQIAGQKEKRQLHRKAIKHGAKYAAKKTAKSAAKAGLMIGAAGITGYTAYAMSSQGRSIRANKAYNQHLKSMGYGKRTHIKSYRPPTFGKPIKALPRGKH